MTWVWKIESIQEDVVQDFLASIRSPEENTEEAFRAFVRERAVEARISGRTLTDTARTMAAHKGIREYNGTDLLIKMEHTREKEEQQQQQQPIEINDGFQEGLMKLREMLFTKKNIQKVVVCIENGTVNETSFPAWNFIETVLLALPGLEDLKLTAGTIPIKTLKSIVQGIPILKKLDISVSLSKNDPDQSSLSSIFAHHPALESLFLRVRRLKSSGGIEMLHGIPQVPKLTTLRLFLDDINLGAEFWDRFLKSKRLLILSVQCHSKNVKSMENLLRNSKSLKIFAFDCSPFGQRRDQWVVDPWVVDPSEDLLMMGLADALQSAKSLHTVRIFHHCRFARKSVKRFAEAARLNNKFRKVELFGENRIAVKDETIKYYCKMNQSRLEYDKFTKAKSIERKLKILEGLAKDIAVLFHLMKESEHGPTPLVKVCESAVANGDDSADAVDSATNPVMSNPDHATPDSVRANTIKENNNNNNNNNNLASSFSGKRAGSERATSLVDPRPTKIQRL